MKISRVRHVVITSIIFLIIIAIIVMVYNAQLAAIPENAKTLVNMVIAKRDIAPGTKLTENDIEVKQIQPIFKDVKNVAYRLEKNTPASREVNSESTAIPNDNLWALGKVATERIYEGEMVIVTRLKEEKDYFSSNERLYSVPFESATTGGYNVDVGEAVDLCVLYEDDTDVIRPYQNLPANKAIDIVLAKKTIIDIRDESGNSAIGNAAVVPGYICFKLTYDEINKLEIAKRQGQIFIGKVGDYIGNPHAETFMSGAAMPTIQ